MIAWMNSLTDIPDWDRKIFDPEFTFQWKSAKLLTGYDTTRSMTDWVCGVLLDSDDYLIEILSASTKSLITSAISFALA